MFHVVARRASIYNNFVADCRDGFCTCECANSVQNGFCVRFCVAKHGYFDKFVQIESGGDVDNLIITDAVFADLEYGGYVLRHTAKMRALS